MEKDIFRAGRVAEYGVDSGDGATEITGVEGHCYVD